MTRYVTLLTLLIVLHGPSYVRSCESDFVTEKMYSFLFITRSRRFQNQNTADSGSSHFERGGGSSNLTILTA